MYFNIINDFFCGGYESSTPARLTNGIGKLEVDPALEKNDIFPGIF
jgi:hypothetical protein